MLRRPLGSTGVRVSALGLGTVKFGRNTAVHYARPFELPNDAQIAELLATAKSRGVNLLDTAPAYGNSESRLGEAIQDCRDDWVVCTKAGEEFDGSRSRYDFSEDHVLMSVERSLARLRTDRIEIVLVHSDGRGGAQIEAAGAFRALARLRREGVVTAIGFSGRSVTDGRSAMGHSNVLMCTINAVHREEVPLAAEAAGAGVGVLVKKPFAQGRQTDVRQLAEIATLPGVTAVVAGTTSCEHLEAAATALGQVSSDQARPWA
ncbi:MAG: aldo/keto reductase [Pseudomonadales bacterium]|nr:aldo/keto reductase [Pseudomonadales bacterium]